MACSHDDKTSRPKVGGCIANVLISGFCSRPAITIYDSPSKIQSSCFPVIIFGAGEGPGTALHFGAKMALQPQPKPLHARPKTGPYIDGMTTSLFVALSVADGRRIRGQSCGRKTLFSYSDIQQLCSPIKRKR